MKMIAISFGVSQKTSAWKLISQVVRRKMMLWSLLQVSATPGREAQDEPVQH
ncbi:MAG: hypothetical protein WCE62_02745 [Polyangiales bacterium]